MVGSVRPSVAALLLSSLAVAGTLAGCVGDDSPKVNVAGPGAFVDPMAFVQGHDHGDYALHDLAWNLTELGYTPMMPDLSVAWGEMDVKDDMAVVAFAWPTAGIATVDVSVPSAPKLLSYLDLGYGYGADVKWSDTGPYAVVAVQAHSSRGLPSPLIDPLASTTESGIRLLHITEAGEIHDVGAWVPAPTGGTHMVFTHIIGDTEYVFAAYNGRGVGVYAIRINPDGGARLEPVNAVFPWNPLAIPSSPTSLGFSGAHDMTVIDDPVLHKPLLYVADGYRGLYVYDISDPTDPLWPDNPLGSWRDPDNTWYMHTVQATITDDGRRLVILAPEVFSDGEAEVVAPLWLLDATDLAALKVLATWKNPGDHGAEQLRYSVHNFQFVDGRIALAHYHGGVWLLDVDAAADNASITASGYLLPSHDPGRAMSGIYHGVYNMEDAPTVWDVVVHKGVVYATDVNSGLYAITTPAWTPGDANVTSLG